MKKMKEKKEKYIGLDYEIVPKNKTTFFLLLENLFSKQKVY